MKETKKMSGSNPTIMDVMIAIQDLTEAVQIGFAKNDAQHDEIKIDISDVDYRVMALEKRTGSLEISIEDMKETLVDVARVVDKDAVAILDHEHRIHHLEKVSA